VGNDELIRKRDAIKEICEDIEWLESQGCTEIPLAERKERDVDIIKNLPSVQPKRGHWMIEPTKEPEWCKCSECGYTNLIVEVFSLDGYHYCPNCGAKMER